MFVDVTIPRWELGLDHPSVFYFEMGAAMRCKLVKQRGQGGVISALQAPEQSNELFMYGVNRAVAGIHDDHPIQIVQASSKPLRAAPFTPCCWLNNFHHFLGHCQVMAFGFKLK